MDTSANELKEKYITRGAAFVRMNRTAEGMRCFREALRHGDDYRVYYTIGSVFYKQGKFKKAVLELEKSRRLNDGFGPADLLLGLSFNRLGNYRAAEASFLRALDLMTENRVALMGLAVLYYDTGRPEKALECIDRLRIHDIKNMNLRKFRADILYRLRKLDESAEEFKELALEKDRFRSYTDLARAIPKDVYTDKYGTLAKKISALESSHEKSREQLVALSLCYLLGGDSGRAIDCLFGARKLLLN
ncbi:MAG TPA: tetratricopeptide repeat protein [Spirochaetes bacterium]|nr:tetratricopeptide repeat protein [Spirochaetota bacterium]